jgi:hypothetical protein
MSDRIKYNQGDRVKIVIEGTVNNFYGDNSNSEGDSLGIETEYGEVYLEVEKKLKPFVEVQQLTVREQFDALPLGANFALVGPGYPNHVRRIKVSATQYFLTSVGITVEAAEYIGVNGRATGIEILEDED